MIQAAQGTVTSYPRYESAPTRTGHLTQLVSTAPLRPCCLSLQEHQIQGSKKLFTSPFSY